MQLILSFSLVSLISISANAKVDSKLAAECEKASSEACLKVGNTAYKRKDWITADKYFDKGCELGSGESCRMMGHANGKMGEPNVMRYLFDLACVKGSKQGCDELSRYQEIYETYGTDVEEFNKTKSKLGEAQLTKEERKELEEARIAEKKLKDEEKRKNDLVSSCDKGKSKSCLQFGYELANEKNFERALEFFEKACDAKSLEGCHRAGQVAIETGSIDYGRRLFNNTCEKGYRPACKDLDRLSKYEREYAQQVEAEQHRQNMEQRAELARQQQQQYEAAQEQRRRQQMLQSLQHLNNVFNPPQPKRTNCRTFQNGYELQTVCEEQ